MRYRRADIPGACYFFTLNLADRQRRWLTDHVDKLRESIRGVKGRYPFNVDAIVVLPDHLHAILTLPEGDADFSTRWALIKAGFSRALNLGEAVSPSRKAKGERGIWQRRFWEHLIRDDRDFATHVDYIHFNPVKHGYAKRPAEWRYSSIHRYIREGIIDANWGCAVDFDQEAFGERMG
ncbi:MAG: transposase [Thiotrichales bacterium]